MAFGNGGSFYGGGGSKPYIGSGGSFGQGYGGIRTTQPVRREDQPMYGGGTFEKVAPEMGNVATYSPGQNASADNALRLINGGNGGGSASFREWIMANMPRLMANAQARRGY